MHIIPAIDLIEGRAVRLTQGDYATRKIYNTQPLEVAKAFEDAGLTRLHLVDLDGAKARRVINYKVLETIASRTNLHIDFGGGVQSDEDLQRVLDCGAAQVTAGSLAVRQPEVVAGWLARHGAERIMLGADARHERIAVSGWQEATDLWVYDFIADWQQRGIRYVISTDVGKDGLLQGSNQELYQKIIEKTPDVQLIASGGVSSMAELEQLAQAGLFGAIVGKALYEGHISLKELSSFTA